jgi:hypothetical protein
MGKDQQCGPSAPQGPEDHFANFIACVVSRKKEDLRAAIEESHISFGLAPGQRLVPARAKLNFGPETQLEGRNVTSS